MKERRIRKFSSQCLYVKIVFDLEINLNRVLTINFANLLLCHVHLFSIIHFHFFTLFLHVIPHLIFTLLPNLSYICGSSFSHYFLAYSYFFLQTFFFSIHLLTILSPFSLEKNWRRINEMLLN